MKTNFKKFNIFIVPQAFPFKRCTGLKFYTEHFFNEHHVVFTTRALMLVMRCIATRQL